MTSDAPESPKKGSATDSTSSSQAMRAGPGRRGSLVSQAAPTSILKIPSKMSSHSLSSKFAMTSPKLKDWMVEQDGFEPPVPLVSGERGRFLPVSVLCPALSGGAEPDQRTTGF
jgi:hypothetical protein